MFECLKDKWHSDFVLRQDLSKFTGGLLNEHTFSSSFYRHATDLPKATRIAGKTVYKVDDLIAWLNAQPVEKIEDDKDD